MIGTMKEELGVCVGSVKSFFKKQKGLRWFCAVVIAMAFGFRLVNQDIFVDSDLMITVPRALLKSWIGCGRYGFVFTKYLFSLTRFAPFFATLLAVVTLWLFGMFAAFCMNEWTERKASPWGIYIFLLMFLTAPVFAEQYLFTLQAFEVTLGMLLCLLSVYMVGKWVYDGAGIWWAVAGLVMLVWALGSYQAMYSFFITWAIISFILKTLFGRKGCGFREGFLLAVFFIIAYICSQCCAWISRLIVPANTAYVDNMIWWGKVDKEECIRAVILEAKRIYQGEWPVFYSRLFTPALLVMICLGIYKWKRQAVRKNWTFFFALLLLCFMPMMIPLLTGMHMPVRGQLTFPLVFAFALGLSQFCLEDAGAAVKSHSRVKKAGVALFGLIVVLAGWRQLANINQLWETVHEQYVCDTLTATRLYSDICEEAGDKANEYYEVVFVGTIPGNQKGYMLTGDCIGHSFFDWFSEPELGVTGRVCNFMLMLGYDIYYPSMTYEEAEELAEGHPAWPAEGSVFWADENLMVVKLSE